MATERELNILIKARDEASKILRQHEDAFNAMGKGLLAAGAAGAAGLGFAIKAASDFEAEMSRVGALSGATDKELQKLEKTAIDLGASTKFSAGEAAQGMQYLAMAGFETSDIISAMPALLDAAAAGNIDLATSADIVSNIMSGMGIAAEDTARIADVLTKTFTSSNTTMGDLGETMKYVAPVAAAAGFSLEELSAATGLLGNAGIQGSQAGTSLRSIIMRLQAPTKEAAGIMQELGINVRDAEGNMKSMPDILAEFENGLKGVDQATKDQAISAIIGMEAASGFQALMSQGSDVLRNYTGEIENSAGVAGDIAAKQMDNLKGAVEEMTGALETAAIIIGNQFIPYVRNVVEFVRSLIERFNGLDPSIQKLVTNIMIAGTVFSLLTGALMVVMPLLPAIGAAIAALVSPIGLLIIGIGALAAAFALNLGGIRDKVMEWITGLMGDFEGLRAGFQNSWATIKAVWDAALAGIMGIVNFAFPYIQQLISGVMNHVVPFIIQTWSKISQFINDVLPPIVKIVTWAFQNVIQPTIKNVMDFLIPFIKNTWNVISGIFSGVLDFIMGIIKAFVSVLTGDWRGALDGLKQAASGVWTTIKTIFSGGIENIKNIVVGVPKLFLSQIGSWASAGADLIVGFIGGINKKAGQIAKAAVDAVKGALNAAKNFLGIKSPSREFMAVGEFSGEGWIAGINGMVRDAQNASKELAAATMSPMSDVNLAGAAGGSTGSGNSGESTVILQFQAGSINLPSVKNGRDFVESLQGFSLRQAFKTQ